MAFTNYIQQITATNGTTHDLVDTSASHYVKGTQTSSTNAWTGALPDGVTAYYDGLSIDYFLPYAGTSSAATLNLGSKGAKPVYYGNGTGAVTTHYPQYSVIHLTYIINSALNSGNGCWKADAYYNTNTTYSAGTGLSLSSTTFSANLGFTTSGNNRAVLADTNGKLYVTQKDDNTTYSAGTGLSLSSTTFNHSNSVTAQTTQAIYPIKIDAQGHISAYGSAVSPLTSHQTIKQDGVTGATGNHFGTSSTAAGTAAKTVSITAGTPTLETGLRVTVKFSNANTANSPTLNVNSTGAKNIFHNGAQITSGSNKALLAGTVEFVYDGTQWQLVGNYVDTNTTYTIPTSAASKVTGISISDHGTTSVGSASNWSAGTASSWAFEDISCDDITSWSAGSGSASISGAVDGSDSTQLNITISHTHTAPSLGYTARTVSSKKSGSNSTVPSLTITSTTVVNGKSHSITDNGHTHTLS